MTVSQNNQQNALPNGLGGVSLQTYHYDAMNRLRRSSGGNSDAGVSYNFQQTYSPSGRIGDKTCDFSSQNDGFYYDASGYQMHALRKTMDGTTDVPCDFIYDENGNMQGYSVKEGAFVSYNIWNAANQMVATVNTRACGYYGYGMDDSGNQLNVDDYGGGITDTKSNTISISPNPPQMLNDLLSDDNKFTKFSVKQNRTTVLFHEIGEYLTKNDEYRKMPIDIENIVRNILNMKERPYDLYHSPKVPTVTNK